MCVCARPDVIIKNTYISLWCGSFGSYQRFLTLPLVFGKHAADHFGGGGGGGGGGSRMHIKSTNLYSLVDLLHVCPYQYFMAVPFCWSCSRIFVILSVILGLSRDVYGSTHLG